MATRENFVAATNAAIVLYAEPVYAPAVSIIYNGAFFNKMMRGLTVPAPLAIKAITPPAYYTCIGCWLAAMDCAYATDGGISCRLACHDYFTFDMFITRIDRRDT
jgi:hypothetical protein